MKRILIIDGDTLSYRASAAIEKRTVEVLHVPSGKTKTFNTRTEFKQSLEAKNKQFDANIYKFKDVQEPEDISHALHIMKKQIEGFRDTLFADEYLVCLSGKSNFRDNLALPSKYKGNRTDMIRPLHLKEAKRYLYTSHPSLLANHREADDDLIIKGYEYLEKGYTPILISQDKDAYAYSNLTLYDYTKETPELKTIPDGLGELYITNNGTVKGIGFIWFVFQWINGDPTDNYKPTELSRKKFGEKTAYKFLKDCTDEKQALEVAVKLYNEWYGKGVSYVDCFGEKHFVKDDTIRDLYFKCARMMCHENDTLCSKEFLERYGL